MTTAMQFEQIRFSSSELYHFVGKNPQTPSPSLSKRRGQVTQRGFGDPAKDRHHLPLTRWHFGSAQMGQQTNKQPKKVGGKSLSQTSSTAMGKKCSKINPSLLVFPL